MSFLTLSLTLMHRGLQLPAEGHAWHFSRASGHRPRGQASAVAGPAGRGGVSDILEPVSRRPLLRDAPSLASMVTLMLAAILRAPHAYTNWDELYWRLWPESSANVFRALPIFVLAYMAHFNALMHSELSTPGARGQACIVITIAVSTSTYLLFGVAGYLGGRRRAGRHSEHLRGRRPLHLRRAAGPLARHARQHVPHGAAGKKSSSNCSMGPFKRADRSSSGSSSSSSSSSRERGWW